MNTFVEDVLFEHRFWLQILGDHARFIFTTLAVTEKQEIEKANMFIRAFDSLLEKSRHPLSEQELALLNKEAYQLTCQLREFKLYLLRRHLTGKIKIQLPPTFLNHMVNELEEYIRVLLCLVQGNPVPTYHPIHHHLLWLQDAIGHAATITCSVDEVERDVQLKSKKFNKNFENLYMKAVEFAGYLRTHVEKFPALDRFNHQVELEMFVFLQFLNEIEEMSLDDQLLGRLSPLMPDHMSREECYYLTKLAGVTEIQKPNCNADKPRIDL